MRRLSFLCLALALSGMALAGCGLIGGEPQQAAAPAPAPRADLLAPGDTVRIMVAGEQELSGTFPVGRGGTVHLELVGDVRAAGLTPRMLAENLRQRLAAGYLKNPVVTVARAAPGAPAAGQPMLVGSLSGADEPPPPPLQGSLSESAAANRPARQAAKPRPSVASPAPELRQSRDMGQPY
ncbi:MAG: hypothetical protein BGN85_05430 [Alphaproteobacteria bacterium 64-11]|nr:polysaccharide biosynthesis/export family protein [Alphaproteobacteria bacterium]OJU11067.1 MAG: hypothetical protein BGN85_05430 [Alphaproteobacteria bacterium 64-11]